MSLAGSSDQPTPKGTEQGKVHAQSSSHDEVSTDDGYAPLISNVGIRCKNRTEPCPCGCSTVEGGGGGMAPTTTTNTGLSVSAISATPWTANAGENDQGGKCTATVLRKVKGASGSSVGRAQDGNQGSQPNAGPPRRSGRVGDNAYRLQAEGPKPQIMSDLRDLDVATVNNRRRATCRYKCSHDDNVRRASASSLMPTALVDDMDERAKARVDTIEHQDPGAQNQGPGNCDRPKAPNLQPEPPSWPGTTASAVLGCRRRGGHGRGRGRGRGRNNGGSGASSPTGTSVRPDPSALMKRLLSATIADTVSPDIKSTCSTYLTPTAQLARGIASSSSSSSSSSSPPLASRSRGPACTLIQDPSLGAVSIQAQNQAAAEAASNEASQVPRAIIATIALATVAGLATIGVAVLLTYLRFRRRSSPPPRAGTDDGAEKTTGSATDSPLASLPLSSRSFAASSAMASHARSASDVVGTLTPPPRLLERRYHHQATQSDGSIRSKPSHTRWGKPSSLSPPPACTPEKPRYAASLRHVCKPPGHPFGNRLAQHFAESRAWRPRAQGPASSSACSANHSARSLASPPTTPSIPREVMGLASPGPPPTRALPSPPLKSWQVNPLSPPAEREMAHLRPEEIGVALGSPSFGEAPRREKRPLLDERDLERLGGVYYPFTR